MTVHGIGLMSGTSADGITALLARLTPESIEPIMMLQVPFPSNMQRWILGLPEAPVRELARANFVIGEAFAAAAQTLMRRAKRRRVDFIASHGQTIAHAPPEFTLQIGEPSVIAERTGVTTVADFRPRDLAAGGEGAPLVPYFDHFVFSGRAPIAMLNIGGIANFTLVTRDPNRVRAQDTGPGNCMIDEAVRRATRGRLSFDDGGRLAEQGDLDVRLLGRLEAHPFFARPAPKSACRSDFIPLFFDRTVASELRRRPLDVIATLTCLTARTIARALPPDVDVIASGGGAYNRTLLHHLRSMVFPRRVESIQTFGWHPFAKEAACFALLGYLALRGLPNHLPSATGARSAAALGKIIPGKNFANVLQWMK